jgi:hypothetical protein
LRSEFLALLLDHVHGDGKAFPESGIADAGHFDMRFWCWQRLWWELGTGKVLMWMCWIDARLRINEGTVCRSSAWRFAEMFADVFCQQKQSERRRGRQRMSGK